MSGIRYNPIPARVWSRVQNRCSTDTASSTVDYARIDYERQMLLKGNILQYKKNSSNLTKNQRYTQIAKGMWTNRTKTWATQSDTYTNPNNSSLLRVNNTILDPSNNTFSSPSNPFNCPTTEIPDGGNLVCNVVVDPCTQEVIKRSVSQQLCNPTTDSDVPGQIQQLCWNDGTQTWYPRQRYTMGNSGTSWPEGYKGFVSALTPAAPVLTLDSSNNNSITLSWTAISNDCIPITSFNIYQNGVLIGNVLYPINTITIDNICGSYSFYVTSLSSDTQSEPSNIVSYSNATNAPTVSLLYIDPNSINLSWIPVINAVLYNIYQIGVGLIDSTTSTNVTISIVCGLYSYYVTALNNGCESAPSNTVSHENTINAPTGLSYSSTSTVNEINLFWNSVSNATYYNVYNNNNNVPFLPNITTTSTIISNLCGTNTFTVTACINSDNCESGPSDPVTFLATQYTTTGNVIINNNNISFLSSGSTITFYCTTNIKYMLVGGGASGGYDSALDTGLAAGGGGHVMNSTSTYTMSNGDNLSFTIGAGGIANTGTGYIGGDTSMSGTIIKTTSNSTYGGGGGRGLTGIAYNGGGGINDNITSAKGGIYTSYYSSSNNNGTGGAGGSLTTETSTLTTLGNGGGSNSLDAAGNGGAGQLGIDGIRYGGGGGGGIRYVEGTSELCGGGAGGAGGGGAGATPSSSAIPGTPNTGGGGGAGYYLLNRPYPSANGGSGIAIITIQ
jgi:hypothetical protein